MEINKLNGELAFNEESHKYWNTKFPDRQYISVTTIIGKYHEHFDANFWSSYKALEKILGQDFVDLGVKTQLLKTKQFNQELLDTLGVERALFLMTQEEILAGYSKANLDACDRGTKYHNRKEDNFYKKPVHNLEDYGFNLPIEGQYVCEKNNFDLSRERAVLPEYLVYYSCPDKILNIAGQIDLLIKDGNSLYILDYKTNAKGIETKAYFDRAKKKNKTMYFPINNLDDTTLIHYTMQLSIYAWMLQKINPEFEIQLLKLLHIDGNDVETEIEVEYKKTEVERLLSHYKKELKTKYFRENGKILEGK